MATVAITSPAAGSPIATPFDLSGTCTPATAQVEVRGENGLLVPATANPVAATGGSWTMHITGLIGTKGATYSSGNSVIEAAAGADAIIFPADAESVSAPVTFTGTSSNGATVELWDSNLVTPVLTYQVKHSTTNLAANGTETATGLSCAANSYVIIGTAAMNRSANIANWVSVTVNGNAATLLNTQIVTTYSKIEIWGYWTSVALSNVSVVATINGFAVDSSIIVATTPDVTSTAGAVGAATANSATAAVSVTATAALSKIVASTLSSTSTIAPSTNTTELSENGWNGWWHSLSYNTETVVSGNSYTVTNTHTSGVWAAVAAEIKP